MQPYLVVDVGGTHVRLALFQPDTQELTASKVFQCRIFSSLNNVLQQYLNNLTTPRPIHAAIAIATQIQGDWVKMTNHSWAFSIQSMQNEFNFKTLLVLNDFTALALSLPLLSSQELDRVCGGEEQPHHTLGLIGAGTGLGVSGLVWGGTQYYPLATEGGHTTYVPLTEREKAMANVLQKEYQHVSFERVASGMGFGNIYHALCVIDGISEPTPTPATIIQRATMQTCPRCTEVLDIFCAALGCVAGNVALTLGATGGMYIGGGIVPKLGSIFKHSAFTQRFVAKGRFHTYLQAIPVYIITAELPALRGAAVALQRRVKQ